MTTPPTPNTPDPEHTPDPRHTPGTSSPTPGKNRQRGWLAAAIALGLILVIAVVYLLTKPEQTLTTTPAPAPITSGPTATASAPTQPGTTAAQTPTTTASKKPSVTATPGAPPTAAPATMGTLPDGFRLLNEGTPQQEDISAWELAPWAYGCPSKVPVFGSLTSLTASRNIEASGPEWGASETILVFTTDAQARQFLTELQAVNAGCAGPGDDAGSRIQTKAEAFEGTWESGLSLRMWDEATTDGGTTWTPRPGASLVLAAQKGKAVTLSSQGGEFMGDPLALPEMLATTRKAIDAVVPQMCAFTEKGC